MGAMSRLIATGPGYQGRVIAWLKQQLEGENARTLKLVVRHGAAYAVVEHPASDYTSEGGIARCPYVPDERGMIRDAYVLTFNSSPDRSGGRWVAVRCDDEACGPVRPCPRTVLSACSEVVTVPAEDTRHYLASQVRAYRDKCASAWATARLARKPGVLVFDRPLSFSDGMSTAWVRVVRRDDARGVRYVVGGRPVLVPGIARRPFTWYATAEDARSQRGGLR